MARVTNVQLQERIKELEQDRITLQEQCLAEMQKNAKLREQIDEEFKNSIYCKQLEKRVKYQQTKIELLEGSLKWSNKKENDLRNYINEHNIEQYQIQLKERDERISELEKQIDELKKNQAEAVEPNITINEHNIEHLKNRKAGRPQTTTDETINFIIEYKKRGYSVRTIANQLGLSVGTVHRYLKLNNKN